MSNPNVSILDQPQELADPPKKLRHAICKVCLEDGDPVTKALCGTPFTKVIKVGYDVTPENCVVCADLVNLPCRKCGSDA